MRRYPAILVVLLLGLGFTIPYIGHGQDCSAGATQSLCNPITVSQGNIAGLVQGVIFYAGTLIGVLALLIIVYSGLKMLLSNGDPQKITEAKASFTWAIIGLVVSILSFVIVFAFQNFIGVDPNAVNVHTLQNPLGDQTLSAFLLRILQGLLSIVGAASLVMIVVNGFRYITSAGNEEQMAKAKAGLTWAVLGFLTALLAFVIINAASRIFI
jgi:hypothetical protein